MITFIYFIIFAIGTLIGSFCTLAVYRIPLKKNITHENSFCPKCNHKLAFLDLIPVLSYLFLRGKCRYCSEKIRIRYFLLEILSGLLVLLFAISINFSFYTIELNKIVYFIFGIFYIVSLTLIAGIDKEKIEIQKKVLFFGFICEVLYILYLSIVEDGIVDRYAMYLFVMLILICIDTYMLKKKQKSSYTIQILMLMSLFMMFTTAEALILTVVISLLAIAIKIVRNKNMEDKKIPIGFYLCVSNLIMIIIQNFAYFY